MARVNGYNERKGAQVVSFFASKCPENKIHVLKVVKLIYLSDRESLKRHGFPILDDEHYSLPHGPVNTCTKDFLDGTYETSAWSEFVTDREKHMVQSRGSKVDDLDELSDADIECMEAVWDKFGGMDRFDLVEWTHDSKNVPEWEDPNGGASKIPLSRTLDRLGFENSDEQAAEIEDHRYMSAILRKLSA